MTEVSKMSDFELDRKILLLVYPTDSCMGAPNKHFLSNWNHLMELVIELRIIFLPYKDDLWEVYHHEYSDCIEPRYPNDDNLQRALAECIYLVLQEKSNKKDLPNEITCISVTISGSGIQTFTENVNVPKEGLFYLEYDPVKKSITCQEEHSQ